MFKFVYLIKLYTNKKSQYISNKRKRIRRKKRHGIQPVDFKYTRTLD